MLKVPNDPYLNCPEYQTENFRLRLVSENDAEDLLACYSDPKARKFFNADNCTSDFCYDTVVEMRDCIRFWLKFYEDRAFIRFAVVDLESQIAIGTVEMFGGARGVLRIDLAFAYETLEYISELLVLADEHFFKLFETERIVTKAVPEACERVAALLSAGYAPFERKHYYSKTID